MLRRESIQPQTLWWGVATAWWTLSGFASAAFYLTMESGAGRPVEWELALRSAMTTAYLWIPLTVLALWLAERFPLEASRWKTHLGVHVLAGIVVCVVRAGAVVVLNPWVGWYAELPPFGAVLTRSFANNLFLYWMLTGAAHALHYARRAQQRETQLAEARLHALKAQIHPHFLFNTLNTVTSYVHDDPDTAERIIARLSELLRHTLESADTHEVSLDEELEALSPYLEIEQIRFEERLSVRWRVDAAARRARVPHLLLQPLVENAVRHGIAPRGAGGTIEISAERDGDRLRLRVSDDGVGRPPGARGPTGLGVGLTNTRARLQQLYGDDHGFEVVAGADGGFSVTIRLPFRPADASLPRQPIHA
jgi:two-component system, LytTR family, sensor kinase